MGDKYNIIEGIKKFPSFNYKELNDLVSKQEIFPIEETINSLKSLKSLFEQIDKEVINLIENNLNNFNVQANSYNKKTFYYAILANLNLKISEIVEYKFDPQNKEFKFNLEEYVNNMKSKYGTNSDYESKFNSLKEFIELMNKIYNSEHECGFSFLNVLYNYLICFNKEILGQINLFKKIQLNKNNIYNPGEELILLDLITYLEKLYTTCIFQISGYFTNKNDIFNQDTNSEDWKNISRITYDVIFSGKEDIHKTFKMSNLDSEQISSALLTSYDENSFGISNAAKYVSKYYQYKKNSNLMLLETKRALLTQNKNLTSILMNIVNWPIFKKLVERDFQKINYRKKIYVKKEYPDISLDYIQKLLKLMGNQYIDASNIKQEIIYKTQEDIINNKEIPKNELYKIKPEKNIKKYYVSTTLLHSSNIDFPPGQTSIFNPFSYFQKPAVKPESLMIFIHGGGFIGMSTHSHELFLRDWVNRFNIPIIGINYGLSPKHKYPYGLNDCYQGYRWIINHCKDVLGFNPKKIILSGDSSGGTFVLSLLYLIIAQNEFENQKIRLPDLVLPLYPCCNTSIKNMGTSMLLSLKDFLLNDKFLIYVNESYRDIYSNDDDPFLNPEKVKDCILKKLPRMRIQFGSCDPLRDDIIRLLAKIAKIKELDVKAYEFREYYHGWNGLVKTEYILKVPRELIYIEIKDIL